MMRAKWLVALVLCVGTPTLASENCWVSAGDRYGVDPWLLYSIAHVESSHRPDATNLNEGRAGREPTEDVGIMQINSWWLPRLAEYGIGRDTLFDPCINIYVGAWILAQSLQLFEDLWEGVGAYNAGTGRTENASRLRRKYAEKVRVVYDQYLAAGL